MATSAPSEPTSTKYGGGSSGPRARCRPQKAERDPWLTRIFAGYLFAVDYRDRRGHAFMLQDQEVTKRNVPARRKQSGNCLHCHASIMPLYRKLGQRGAAAGAPTAEQVQKGLERGRRDELLGRPQAARADDRARRHPVSCVDCHDPKTMELRVTRPGFITGIQKLAASERRRAAPAEHRALAPGRPRQALRPQRRRHPPGDALVRLRPVPRRVLLRQGHDLFFPWDQGLKVEQIEQPLRRHAGARGTASRTGTTPRPAWRCSRPSIPSSRSGARASTPGAASPAPTATCPTSARAR